MSETARRIRLLIGLLMNNDTTETYSPQSMVLNRLKRLESTRQVRVTARGYQRKTSSLMMAALLIRALERLLFPYRETH